jgi:hypothetical protein
MIKLIAHNT